MNMVDIIESENLKKDVPEFNIGDTVKVFVKIKEGDKERIQAYEGVVIARKNGSVRETFTVRRISYRKNFSAQKRAVKLPVFQSF